MAAPKGNKFALGLENSGKPPIYSNDEKGFIELQEKVIAYFDECEQNKEKATITGLALRLGFSARKTLYEYAKKEVFGNLIKRAMLTVENSYENSGTTFDMFALKNMGWEDKQTVSTPDLKPPPKIQYYDPEGKENPDDFDISDA